MKIALIASARGWHVRDLLRAASSMQLEMEVVEFPDLRAAIGSGIRPRGRLLAGGIDLERADVVLVRTMPAGSLEQVVYRMDALHWLESRSIPVVNPPRALETAIDKYLSLSRLAAAGLPVPPTAVSENTARALEAFEELGGDVVLKPLFGSEGRDLSRISRREEAAERFRRLEEEGAVIYQQKFIDHRGWDLRVLVLGDEVAGSMKRRVEDGWITNIARGGRAERHGISAEARTLAIEASRAVGARVAGVDLLPDRSGDLRVLEVNAVPGWRALGKVCRRDFARDILTYLVEQSRGR